MPVDPLLLESAINRLQRRYNPSNPWSGHRVMGRWLRPFSLWHRFLLRSVDSPILHPDARLTPLDVDRAVSVCRCRYREANFDHRHPLRVLWSIAAGGLEKQKTALREYVEDFSQPPDYKVVPRPVSKGAAPSMPAGRPEREFTLACDIIEWSKWNEQYVWEMPIGMAEWYASRALESQGAQLDYKDREAQEYFAQMKAHHEAEGKGGSDASGN